MRTVFIAALVLFGAPATGAVAQEVTTDVVARGNMEHSAVVDGPATVYIGTIQMAPGSSYAGWHTHPGPVWVVVTSGELALYGADTCRTAYATGMAYLAEPQTQYDLRNETDEPLELHFAGVIPAGQPPTVPAAQPSATCGG